MRIVIYGCGGVGGYFGARLAQAQNDVTFIARGEHLQAMRENGLRVRSVLGDIHLPKVKATQTTRDVGEVDFVLLAVKAWQLEEAAAALPPLLGAETGVVTLQNGVDAPRQVAAAIGARHVLPGLVKLFTRIAAPGCIEHVGGPASIAFAEWDNKPSERTSRLRAAFPHAGVTVDTPRDILAALWTKFLLVASFGGMGAVSRAPIGVLRSTPETRLLLERCMLEIAGLASACGVVLPENIVSTTMAFVDAQPATGVSSLQRDIAAGRPSELEAWNGAVVRLARESHASTPLNAFIYHTLLPLERRARGLVTFE